MVLEQLRVANVAPRRVHRLVTGHVHHLEDRSALGRCRCQEAGPEEMSREGARVKARPLCVGLDDISHGSIRQPVRCYRARLVDGPEYRTCLDTRRIQPFQKSPGGACNIAPAIAMVAPAPSWSVLLRRILTSSVWSCPC